MADEFVCGATAGSRIGGYQVRHLHITDATFRSRERIAEHIHARPTLCIVLAGGFTDRFPEDEIECGVGSAVYYVPGQPHSTSIWSGGSRLLDISVDLDFFYEDPSIGGHLEDIGSSRMMIAHADALAVQRAVHIGDELSDRTVEEVVVGLFAQLVNLPSLRMGSRAPIWLRRVRDRLDGEFARLPGLAELAEWVGVHRVHLARQFRHHYGCTTGEYARIRRVAAAAEDLRYGDRALSELAYDLGFSDQSHFSRSFRQAVGISPGAFRRMTVR